MKTIVLSLALALASTAFADEYTPVDWIQVTANGGLEAKIGILTSRVGPEGCIEMSNGTINGVTYSIGAFKWQMRKGEDSEWTDVPGTEQTGAICGIGTIPEMPGEYRPVAEIQIGEEIGKYASGNTLVVAGDPEQRDESAVEETGDETVVEAVSRGFLKSRASP